MESNQRFVQKRAFETRVYTLGEEGVTVERRSPLETNEFMVRYERIGYDVVWKYVRLSQLPQLLYVPLFILGAIALVVSQSSDAGWSLAVVGAFVMVAFGLASIGNWLNRTPNKVFITGNAEGLQELEMFADKPTREEVETFIAEIHKAARQYLRERYFKPDPYLHPEMQRNKFEWLLSAKAITEEEMFDMLKKLRTGGDDRNIGFTGKAGF